MHVKNLSLFIVEYGVRPTKLSHLSVFTMFTALYESPTWIIQIIDAKKFTEVFWFISMKFPSRKHCMVKTLPMDFSYIFFVLNARHWGNKFKSKHFYIVQMYLEWRYLKQMEVHTYIHNVSRSKTEDAHWTITFTLKWISQYITHLSQGYSIHSSIWPTSQ